MITKKQKKELRKLDKKIKIKAREKKWYKKLEWLLSNILNKYAKEEGFFD